MTGEICLPMGEYHYRILFFDKIKKQKTVNCIYVIFPHSL